MKKTKRPQVKTVAKGKNKIVKKVKEVIKGALKKKVKRLSIDDFSIIPSGISLLEIKRKMSAKMLKEFDKFMDGQTIFQCPECEVAMIFVGDLERFLKAQK